MSRKQEAIKLKLEKSESMMMAEVTTLLQNKFYGTAINRLYYSCYHVTKALLLTKELVSKTHSGVGNLLREHFVQKDLFDTTQASYFSKLMDKRMESDYDDTLITDETVVQTLLEPAKAYVEYVTKKVEEYLNN